MFISHSGCLSIMDQLRDVLHMSQKDSGWDSSHHVMLMCPRGKGALKGLPGLMKCSNLEVIDVTFCSQFIKQNMSHGSTQAPGGQEVQPYCVPRREEDQTHLLNGIYHSLSTYHVPGIVLRVFLIDPLIPSTIHWSRDFYLQLILE